MHSRLRSTEISTSWSTKSTEGNRATNKAYLFSFKSKTSHLRVLQRQKVVTINVHPPPPARESSMKVDLFVSSFPNANTSSRVVVFRAGLFELPVRLAVLGSRVRLVILSVRLYSSVGLFDSSFYEVDSLLTTPVRHCLLLWHFVVSFNMAFHHFDVAFHRFDSSTQPGYNSSYITWSVAWCHADTKNTLYEKSLKYLSTLCSLSTENGTFEECNLRHDSSSRVPWMIVFMKAEMGLYI